MAHCGRHYPCCHTMSEFAVPKPIVPARLRTKKKTAKLTASSGPRFTWAQVAKHNTPEDCYVVVHGRVYDVTKYLNKREDYAVYPRAWIMHITQT